MFNGIATPLLDTVLYPFEHQVSPPSPPMSEPDPFILYHQQLAAKHLPTPPPTPIPPEEFEPDEDYVDDQIAYMRERTKRKGGTQRVQKGSIS